jgi:ribose transport system substrate-binding protein
LNLPSGSPRTGDSIRRIAAKQDAKGSRDGGFAVAQTILTRFGHIDGMFIINEEQAIGADLAARQAHRSEMVITTVDGSPDGTAPLKSPESRIFATAAQNPYEIARVAVKLGLESVGGHVPTPSTVLLQPVLVTRDNVDSYKGWVNK